QKGDAKGDPAKGKEVFEANCAICHEVTADDKVGPGLKGISKKPAHKLSDGTEHKDHSAAVLRKQIVECGGARRQDGGARSQREVDTRVAYLRSLKRPKCVSHGGRTAVAVPPSGSHVPTRVQGCESIYLPATVRESSSPNQIAPARHRG